MNRLLNSATESKTYSLLILFAGISLIGVTLASLLFNSHFWGDWIDFLKVEVGIGGGRAVVNDGAPKVAEALSNKRTVEVQQVEVTQTTNDWTTMLPNPTKELENFKGVD